VGGFTMTEIYTDQGLVGFGPGINPEQLAAAKARLIGRDPFDIGRHSRWLQVQGRWGTGVEIALWDLVGKACNQPLNKPPDDVNADVQALRVHVRHLRQKVEQHPDAPVQITTEPGVGYRFLALE
jgi:L-alanine-DL-glutamate epimerase-like enolase superfamily enzyme